MTRFEAVGVLLSIAKGYGEYIDPKRQAGAIIVVDKLLEELEDSINPYWKDRPQATSGYDHRG